MFIIFFFILFSVPYCCYLIFLFCFGENLGEVLSLTIIFKYNHILKVL